MNDQQKKEQYSGVRDQEIRAALDQHWAASDANDFETEHRIYHEDAVLEVGNTVLCGSIRGSRMARSMGRTDGHIISRRENSLTTPPFAVCSIIVENRD